MSCNVRSLPRPDGPRFKDNGDGTITDRGEGLAWVKADCGRPLTIDEADKYCRALSLGGKPGWRIPTLAELRDALYVGLESAKPGLGLDRRIEPFQWSGESYWSEDVIVPDSAQVEGGRGRDVVRFVDGSHGWVSEGNVRLVRACRDGG